MRITLSQGLERSVNQYADIIGRRFCDFGDLLVAKVILEFQLNHFLLPGRQGGNDPE
jgi:hypothetical protein